MVVAQLSPVSTWNMVKSDDAKLPNATGSSSLKSETPITAYILEPERARATGSGRGIRVRSGPDPVTMKRTTKALATGITAEVRAEMILRSDVRRLVPDMT
eukprot:1319624-Rhodomonas_salina.1